MSRLIRDNQYTLLGISVLFLAQLTSHYSGYFDFFDGRQLTDPDALTRLLKVKQLVDGGDWYDPRLYRIGLPAGLDLHWTRLVDILLLPGAWLAKLSQNPNGFLLQYALFMGPALMVASLVMVRRLTRDIFSDVSFLALTAYVLTSHTFFTTFQPGSIDHHGIAAASALLMATALLAGAPTVMGVIAALAIWGTAEAIIPVVCAAIVLFGHWVIIGSNALSLKRFGLAFTLGAALFLMIERPPQDWFSFETDRLSILHLMFAASALLFGWLAATFPHQFDGFARRLGLAVLVAALDGALLITVAPELDIRGYADLPPEVLNFQTGQTIADMGMWAAFGEVREIYLFELGLLIPALGWILWNLKSADENQRRRAWIYLTLIVFSLPYALVKTRGIMFTQAFLIFPMTEFITAAVGYYWTGPIARKLLAVLVSIVLVSGHWTGGTAFGYRQMPKTQQPGPHQCRFDQALAPLRALLDPTKPNDRPRALSLSIFDGPHLAWYGGVDAMVGPFHRNFSPIKDFLDFHTSSTFQKPFEIAKRRRLNLVVLCRESNSFSEGQIRTNFHWFVNALLIKRPPCWMRFMPDLSSTDKRILTYAVLTDSSKDGLVCQ